MLEISAVNAANIDINGLGRWLDAILNGQFVIAIWGIGKREKMH